MNKKSDTMTVALALVGSLTKFSQPSIAACELDRSAISTPALIRWTVLTGACALCAFIASRDGTHLASVMAAIFLSAIVSSIAGFAFPAICGALLFHLSDDPVHMVQIMITCSMANQAALTWAARRNIDWRGLGVYLSGGAFGLMIGVWVLLHSDHTVYCKVLGVLLLSYGAYMLVRKPVVIRRQHAGFDLVSGFVGGITGGAGGTPGIPVTIWCSMKGWDKARQRAVFQPFILLMQTASMLAIGLARNRVASSGGFDTTDLLFVPASLLGTSIGLLFYHRLSNRQFAHALNVLLIVSGLSYVL